MENSSMDGVKLENGVLCGNARLQEAWEPERKGSPDTPWRYVRLSVSADRRIKIIAHMIIQSSLKTLRKTLIFKFFKIRIPVVQWKG
jgi:hypothetical protein